MIVYLDTSVVLRILFRQPDPLDTWGAWEEAYSSELMGVESRRLIDRMRLDVSLDDEGVAQAQEQLALMERTIGRILLTRMVLYRASLPMATSVRTLDAIHLASALLLNEQSPEPIVFATHDRQQATAARALGLECTGV